MSDPEPPRLLVRERGELDAVATPLHEGRRVVAFLVCEAPMRPVVLAYLRERSGVAIPEAEAITDPWRMLDVLTEAAALGPGEIRAIAVDHRVEEVLQTLNWHREKLRRGASVLVWIEGEEGLRALRAMAPDAYSFRDVMVFLAGEEPATVRLPEADILEIQLARIPYLAAESPQERAAAAVDLGFELHRHGSIGSLRDLALDALSAIPEDNYTDEPSRTTRAGLYLLLAVHAMRRGQLAYVWSWAQRGLVETFGTSTAEGRVRRALLLSIPCSPLNTDMNALNTALDEVLPLDPALNRQLYVAATERLDARGRARAALESLGQATMAFSHELQGNWAILDGLRGEIYLTMGNILAAEKCARAAISLRMEAHMSTLGPSYLLAKCLRCRGEHDAASRILENIATSPSLDEAPTASARVIAELHIDNGDVPRGLADLRALIHAVASSSRDGHLYAACFSYVTYLRAAHEATRLSPQDLTDADAELAVAEDVTLSISGADPPWYSILYPGLRAELLSLRPDRLDESITLAAGTVDRARALWPDAVPLHARMHAAHLLRANRLDEALAALTVAEPEAAAQGQLRELARLQALSVAALVRSGANATDIDARTAALRATLDETGAPRIAADTLLDLALLLPASSGRPDPLNLLDEAHALFLEMPIVAQEARCLEAMGDVLAARGLPEDARRRYLAGKAVYERYSLGLRLPLVSAKVDSGVA